MILLFLKSRLKIRSGGINSGGTPQLAIVDTGLVSFERLTFHRIVHNSFCTNLKFLPSCYFVVPFLPSPSNMLSFQFFFFFLVLLSQSLAYNHQYYMTCSGHACANGVPPVSLPRVPPPVSTLCPFSPLCFHVKMGSLNVFHKVKSPCVPPSVPPVFCSSYPPSAPVLPFPVPEGQFG